MVSWSAYHGERQQHVNTRCESSLLPLFAEYAHSLAMIKHAITVVMKAVEHLNPGQTAVIAFDQLLFALAKEIQWRHPDTMGQDKLVIILGVLHIELRVLKAIGSWLSGSGWTEAVAQAGITSAGRAESLVTFRVHYAHQICTSSYSFFVVYTSTEGVQIAFRIRRRCFFIPRLVQRSSQEDPTVPVLEYDPQV